MTFLRNIVKALSLTQVLLTISSFAEGQSPFHAIVSSGYAWTMEVDIRGVDYNFWAPALEGYNANVGNSPFISLGVGYQFLNALDFDFAYTLYDTFYYQKNQTDPYGNKRTRFFDLDHQSSLFNLTWIPSAFFPSFKQIEIIPFIGMGMGVGTSKVSRFETVFYDPLLQGIGLVTCIGSSVTRNSFAWQGCGGIRIRPTFSKLSLDLAYRYYNGGSFDTPSWVKDYNGVGEGQTDHAKSWTGTLQMNELYFSVNFSI